MAERKIVVDIALQTADAANSLKDVKKSLKELKDIQLEFGEGTEEFTKASEKAGELKDRLNAVNDSLKNLSNSPVENVKNSFGTLSSQIRNLDFGGAKQSLKDLGASSGVLVKSVLGLGPGVNTATVAFRGLGAAIAATGIGALAIAIGVIVQNFDKIKESGGILGDTFNAVGDIIESVKTTFLELLVTLGLVDKAVLEDTESQKAYKESIDETTKSIDDLSSSLDKEIALLGKTGAEREKIILDQEINAKKRELLSINDATNSLILYTEYQQLASKGIENLTAQEKFRFEEIAKTDYFKIGKKVQEDLDKIEKIRTAGIKEINKKAAEESQKTRDEAKKKAEKEKQNTLKQLEAEFKAENDADQKRSDEKFEDLKKENARILAEEEKQLAELNKLLTDEIEAQADAQADADNEARRKRIEQREATRQYVQDLSNILRFQNEELNSNALSLLSTAGDAFNVFSNLKDEVFKNDTEKFAAYAQASLQLASSLLNDISNNNKEKIQERLDDLNSSTEEELIILKKRKDDGLITEKEFKDGEYKIRLKAFNDEEKLKKQLFEEDKKAKIAQATISGIQGAIQAFNGAQVIPPPFGQIIGALAAGAVLAFTAKNIQKIQGTQYKGGSAPSAPSGAEGGGGNLPIPNTNTQPTPSPQLLGFGDTGQNNLGTPTSVVRAVVLESDITNAQIRIKNYQTESELGG